jgi:outer membrane immunogenic protein
MQPGCQLLQGCNGFFLEGAVKRILQSVVLSVVMAGPALAADMAPIYKAPPVVAPPAYSWTGFYIGGNAGFASHHSDRVTNLTVCGPCAFNGGFDARDLAAIAANGSPRTTSSGFTGGVQAGYNQQYGNAVFGVEVDFGSFRSRPARLVTAPFTFTAPAGTYTIGTSSSADWLFTARGRLGWAVLPNTMLFATGGVAVADLGVANSYIDTFGPPGTGSSSNKSTKAGWTAGAGVETAINRNWSFKAEYLYMDFGSVTTTMNVTAPGFTPSPVTTRDDVTAHVVRLGLNYRFWEQPIMAKY